MWAQLKAHVNGRGRGPLRDAALVDWCLADSIEHRADGAVVNHEPLLINTAGSWRYRPEAVTRIPNLFLAADYVRTNTDIATMEAANEAARRAVNGILAAAGSRGAAVPDLGPGGAGALQAPAGCLTAGAWSAGCRTSSRKGWRDAHCASVTPRHRLQREESSG